MVADPTVSIIIVNYNAGAFLARCLKTIQEQTFTGYEVIVVDNASSDNSLSTISGDETISIIRNERNAGFAAAQNQGMRQARGSYLMPLNFDIALTPTFLQEMVKAIELSPQIGAVSGKLLRMRSDGQQTEEIDNVGLLLPPNRFPVHRGARELDRGQYDRPMLVFGAMGAAALYRREMLLDIAYDGQYFDESFFMWYEDIDLDWRSRLRGWHCLYAPEAVAYHVGDVHDHGKSRFGAQISMRNRWRTILSNECPSCFLRHAPWLLAEELALLLYVIRRGWLTVYLRAWLSLVRWLPATLRKRRWVRHRIRHNCLPPFPLSFEGEL